MNNIHPVVTTDATAQASATAQRNIQTRLVILAWGITLLASMLPGIIVQEAHISLPLPVLWLQIGLLAALFAVSFIWKTIQPLRNYFLIFIALYALDALFAWIGSTALWQATFDLGAGAVVNDLFKSQLLRLAVALIMILVLTLIFRRRSDFFLRLGELDAEAAPVRWLGMDRPVGWRRFGIILSLCITLGTLVFLILAGRPSGEMLTSILPLLPIILLIAAMNAFSEEISYRAALLAPLQNVVGKSQALLLTATLFGLWHFYGVPYGVLGVLMAGGLGWLLGKSMLETKGIFWAWMIHFWQDVAIFAFICANSIKPGG
ncbi:MAG: CPBP family intramembrane glutamic endopeptidase [Anaerolineae bacterium]